MLTTFMIIVVAILAIASIPHFNTAFIPGPIDNRLKPEPAVTKTASYNGAAQDFGSGFLAGGSGQPTAAVVNVTAIDRADTNETYTFKVQESADNSSWADITVTVSRTATGAFAIPFFLTNRYARVVLTAGGTTPSVTYDVSFTAIQ
jgi:hypothetical protein